mmetsp:Transcript_13042/g.19525  ORF Transcript_13042/g.19525 Transcript_13042/m.19525 type:complete len:305 (+) Transcript_13042:132-1046(+)
MSSEESSSSSEDELPLSSLKNSKAAASPTRSSSRRRSAAAAPTSSYKEQSDNEESEEEAEFDDEDDNKEEEGSDDDDDDSDDEDDDDDDDEDDEPVSALKSPKTKAKAKTKSTAATKKKATKAKPTTTKTKTKTKTAKKKKVKADSPTPTSSSSSAIRTASSELYAKSKKGKLISELLRRWWYAFSWPDASVVNKVPPNCDKFDGFPGVFVVTQGEEVGKIVDMRDQSACPCFRNMALKPSKELKELLLKAIEEQRKILIDHAGKGTQTEQDLRLLEKWVNKLNPNTADKEAEKVLKAANVKVA